MTRPPHFSDAPLPDRVLPARSARRTPSLVAPTMAPVDFDPDGLRIVRCSSCTRWWWAELVLVGRRVQLREWHRVDCADWGDDAAGVPDAAALTSATAVRRGQGFTGLVAVPDADDGPS